MNEVYRKKHLKSVPLIITPEIKHHISLFKESLQCMKDNPEESSAFDARTIDIILNELDDYDKNLLIAYYSIADCCYSKLSKLIGISSQVIHRRLKLIHKKIQEINDTPKSTYNQPRCNPDN